MVHKMLFWSGFGMILRTYKEFGEGLINRYNRPCHPFLAARYRDASFLQQGVTMGVPSLRCYGSKFRLLVAGCGRQTTSDLERPKEDNSGEEGTPRCEGGARKQCYRWQGLGNLLRICDAAA